MLPARRPCWPAASPGWPPRAGLPDQVPPTPVGALASAVGVGGGTLSPPILSLLAVPLARAIGTGALVNLAIALPATGFIPAYDLGKPGRPLDALGDVSLLCLVALSVPALAMAPWPPAGRGGSRPTCCGVCSPPAWRSSPSAC